MSVTGIDDDEDKWQARLNAASLPQLNALLTESARTGEFAHLKQVLARGADLGYKDGFTLVLAASRGGLDMTEFLLARGIATLAPGCLDEALAEAVHYNKTNTVRLLLQQGAKTDYSDAAALFAAAQRGDGEMMEMLLQAGGNATAREGTLLPIALAHRNQDVAMSLLKHGADPASYYRGMNGFEWTAEMGLPEFAGVLRQWLNDDRDIPRAFFENKTLAELRAPMPARYGRSGIHLAASTGNFDIVRDRALAAAPAEGLTAADILHRANGGPSVLHLLGQRGELGKVFDAALWRGRKAEAFLLLREVPKAYAHQLDAPAFLAALDHHALKQAAPKFRFNP